MIDIETTISYFVGRRNHVYIEITAKIGGQFNFINKRKIPIEKLEKGGYITTERVVDNKKNSIYLHVV